MKKLPLLVMLLSGTVWAGPVCTNFITGLPTPCGGAGSPGSTGATGATGPAGTGQTGPYFTFSTNQTLNAATIAGSTNDLLTGVTAMTLPNPAPTAGADFSLRNQTAGPITISGNGLNILTASGNVASVTLPSCAPISCGMLFVSTGTGYSVDAGLGMAGPTGATGVAGPTGATGAVTTTITTGTTANLVSSLTINQAATAAQAVTYTLPAPVAGDQHCVDNGFNGTAPNTGILTVSVFAAGQFILYTDGTLSASGGNLTSGGAARDGACFLALNSTQWVFYPHSPPGGTWAKH